MIATGNDNMYCGGRKQTGTVEKWFEDKGFGFIRMKDDTCIFLHVTKILGHNDGESTKIKEGTNVSFDVIQATKGKQAVDVEILKY